MFSPSSISRAFLLAGAAAAHSSARLPEREWEKGRKGGHGSGEGVWSDRGAGSGHRGGIPGCRSVGSPVAFFSADNIICRTEPKAVQ